jgi:hypothetical protein
MTWFLGYAAFAIATGALTYAFARRNGENCKGAIDCAIIGVIFAPVVAFSVLVVWLWLRRCTCSAGCRVDLENDEPYGRACWRCRRRCPFPHAHALHRPKRIPGRLSITWNERGGS